ncbi:hypothetical protein C1N91_13815 [Curtobacterium sp. SGAir0471]|uniref:hypothetical protein n=1 Tax=Curtobacterium sp. SGAir0471 TaxID=2070337 RepID=UPI0010CD3031|nr:hypothetical protein [Curtobacterium sp. SGAir0471]QCR44435.1 hypothetical protein C1N91_13815 [Curtobacterium sp. SGAir0471]
MDDQRTIAQMNSPRKAFRIVARTGFVVAPAMFLLSLAEALLVGGWNFLPIVSMTAAWAVLVSASSFAAMAATKPGGHPWVHQLWAVPVAIIAMVPGAVIALLLYGWLASAAHHATT